MAIKVRPLDQADGARARHDRAVRGSPGARGRRLVRRCRRTATTSASPTSSRSSRTSTTRSSIPKNFDPRSFVDIKADVCIVPPNSFALARTVEYFRIPRDVLTVCLGKSTYARCGIIVNVTPFEPEWEGTATLEISNTTPLPAKIYANEGIAQVLFFQSDEPCEVSYARQEGQVPGAARSDAAAALSAVTRRSATRTSIVHARRRLRDAASGRDGPFRLVEVAGRPRRHSSSGRARPRHPSICSRTCSISWAMSSMRSVADRMRMTRG